MPTKTRLSRRVRRAVTIATATTACGTLLAIAAAAPASAKKPKAMKGGGSTMVINSSTMVINSWTTRGAETMRLTCPWGPQAAGVPLTLRFTTSNGPGGLANQRVLALVSGPAYASSVAGQPGNTGQTDLYGNAAVSIASYRAGLVNVRGVWDYNMNGVWDQWFEPTTEPTCTVQFV